jgi:hypothetical protein
MKKEHTKKIYLAGDRSKKNENLGKDSKSRN